MLCLTADTALDGVRVLGASALPGFEDGALVDATFDLAERAAAELLRRRPGIGRSLEQLTGSTDVDRYLCRWLLRDSGAFFGLVLLVASLDGRPVVDVERNWPDGPTYAFLSEVARGLDLPPGLADALERMTFAAPRSRLVTTARAAQSAAGLWAEWFARLCPLGRKPPQRPLLIRSYEFDWGIDYGGQRRLRNLDFVVDGETIRASEVGVWAEDNVPVERDALLQHRGYAVLRRDSIPFGFASVAPLLRATALHARIAAAESWWLRPVRLLATETMLWREVGRRVRPRVLFTLNDLLPGGIARTLALRHAGCVTVEYEFSSHWRTDERGWVPDYVYGFAVVDAMVSWGPLHSEHFRNHRGSFGEFWEVGCLWSEHARVVREAPEMSARYRSELGVPLDDYDHVVGVFDTSTASFFGYDDMAAFYAGVAELARARPRVLFLVKPKRPIAEVFANGAGGREVEAAFAAAPNIAAVPEQFETAAVVAFSDLSINACYTSPAVETIGAGRPAVYFDPTDLFPTSFFRRIPDFVATNGEELARLVETQLSGDPRLARFDALEGHFDGRAITRLRERLRLVLDA